MSDKTSVFIASDRLGTGDDELGSALMCAAIKNLRKLPELPSHVLFMNNGVKLCCEGSRALSDLRALAGQGVELLSCGTCLDWFELNEALAAGRHSNMEEILRTMSESRNVVRL